VVTRRRNTVPVVANSPYRRWRRISARTRHGGEKADRRMRVLRVTAWIAAGVNATFGVVQLFTGYPGWLIGVFNLPVAAIFIAIPLLSRYGEFVGPLTFLAFASLTIFWTTWSVGTGTGLQFYFLVATTTAMLTLGIEHIVLVAALTAVGAGLVITLQFLAPADTGVQPAWAQTMDLVLTVTSSCFMVVATMWYALREIDRAHAAMEAEYERSESLLANILPASIAERLKNSGGGVIADKYEDASILFADIADFTERASDVVPADLVNFLNMLYTHFDLLAEKHGLEKVKTSGDSYMVVSGVPEPRPDHLNALADFALDMAAAAARMSDPDGRLLRIRIGVAAGPVVAGVVGAQRFFYDVWGDAVNVAARMESTDYEGRIQVSQDVYERLRHHFVFEERGEIYVKGKGIMHTWYLVGRTPNVAVGSSAAAPQSADIVGP
jgi:adenylate cyclase